MKTSTLPDEIKRQLSTRYKTQNKMIFNENNNGEALILSSPSDIGVIRNGGRQGSFLAPKIILNELGKFQKSSHEINNVNFIQVTDIDAEIADFDKAQIFQTHKIQELLKNNRPTIHLGGGHDHVFPFLMAIENTYPEKKINIINIDAHLDTRQDSAPHSGTPFRQFDLQAKKKFNLHQIGIHSEANTSANYQNMAKTSMNISPLTRSSLNQEFLIKLIQNSIMTNHEWINVLSIDLDALDSTHFTSCSAVNSDGFYWHEIQLIISTFLDLDKSNTFIGLYEYNPVYDDLSNSNGKKIAWQINQILKRIK